METEDKAKRKRTRRNFSDEYKAGAVSLVLNEGKSVAQVAKDLDLTPSSLGKWVEQAVSVKVVVVFLSVNRHLDVRWRAKAHRAEANSGRW